MKWIGETVAVKFINAGSRCDGGAASYMHRFSVWHHYGSMWICDGGTLRVLKNAANAKSGVAYLHAHNKHGAVHCDIKSGNVTLQTGK